MVYFGILYFQLQKKPQICKYFDIFNCVSKNLFVSN